MSQAPAQRAAASGSDQDQRQPSRTAAVDAIGNLLRWYIREDGAAQFSWTEISFETPGSSIVTP